MNQENYNKILEQLDLLSPRKAKKLRELIQLEKIEKDPEKKNEAHTRLWDYIYSIFMTCLTKQSRSELANTSVGINEMCYMIGKQAKDGWIIYSTGAMRIDNVDGELQLVGDIPRKYRQGFILEDRKPTTDEEKKNALKEIDFYTRYQSQLAMVSSEMDYKEWYLKYGYDIKHPGIPKEFVELLITTLGLPRATAEDIKLDQSAK